MSEHVVPIKTYVIIFLALLLGTGVTVWASFADLDFQLGGHTFPGSVIVALVIACTKATLVILFFMHVKYSSRLTWAVVIAGFFWLILLLALTMNDYAFRGLLTYPSQ
ncbi:MAG TPA: cytochrome C oxidase subunit IV family protein [Terriglobales bacterium]|nr:cytochrome C oxidase subunit IV family protein [Terriglobales bacterium]